MHDSVYLGTPVHDDFRDAFAYAMQAQRTADIDWPTLEVRVAGHHFDAVVVDDIVRRPEES